MTIIQEGQDLRIKLMKKPAVNGHCPSVDILFESISALTGLQQHLILMTGMGNDGAKGMLAAKHAGAQSTLVESQETSIESEMPEAAAKLGCVDYELPSHLLASKIMEVTGELRYRRDAFPSV